MDLVKKEAESRIVIEKAFERFGNSQAVAFTGGKDSLAVVHLVKTVCGGHVPIPVVNIDTSVKFEEIYQFRDFVALEWDLNMIVVSNTEALKELEIAKDKKECCRLLKVAPLHDVMVEFKFKAIMTGLRRDEHEVRNRECFFSDREEPAHTRIQPILNFTETDVWEYIRKYQLPYCELYDQGYRSLGCMPCTQISRTGRERQGRSQEKEGLMRDLRQLGYF